MSDRDLAATVQTALSLSRSIALCGERFGSQAEDAHDAAMAALAALERQAADAQAAESEWPAGIKHFRQRALNAESRAVRAEEALRKIAFGFDGDEFQDSSDAVDQHRAIARDALAAAGADTP